MIRVLADMIVTGDVEIATGELRMGGSGSITGRLALRVSERWFPEEHWNDFPVVVLSWWLSEIDGLSTGNGARFDFMDGPFAVQAVVDELGNAVLDFLRDDEFLGEARVAVSALVDSIFAAAHETLAGCEQHEWKTADISALRLHLG